MMVGDGNMILLAWLYVGLRRQPSGTIEIPGDVPPSILSYNGASGARATCVLTTALMKTTLAGTQDSNGEYNGQNVIFS